MVRTTEVLLPQRYAAEAPRLVHRDDGTDVWQFRDTVIPNVALNAVAGRPKEEYGLEPQGLDEIRPGCYDVRERVADMNAGGVLASMNFPSFPGFAARLFATGDPEFSAALVRAYNDWHIEEWCAAYPDRFIPMALPMIWDPVDSDSMWPGAPEELWAVLQRENVPDDDINLITHRNAMRWYHFDPFAHIPREQATVGALRHAAAGHDVSIQPRSHHVIPPEQKLAGYRQMTARAAART